VLSVARSGALEKPLKATYSSVLVDEYQDCDIHQHALVWELSRHLPTRVFGDPMQAIFDFSGPIVSWPQVEAAFPPLARLSTPWRWNIVGCDRLGAWLHEARTSLERGNALDLSSAPPEHVRWVAREDHNLLASYAKALRSLSPQRDERTLIIGHTSTAAVRHEFARRTGGVSIVERADLPDLIKVAATLTASAPSKCLNVALAFAEMVMTKTEPPQMRQRIGMLSSGRGRKAAEPHEQAALDFLNDSSPRRLRFVLLAMAEKKYTRIFRRELFEAMLETLSAARDFSELHRRAVCVRDQRRFGARRLPRRALGTTLLLKGLEADHALILDGDQLEARHLYVAITRGARSLTVISADPVISC
jgi:UvrD/REP helicase N-terminal domain